MDGRLFDSFDPSCDDLAKARQLPDDACPRRYCWWWYSLGFEWEKSPLEGCTWRDQQKPEHWKFRDVDCLRCGTGSPIDHFEPRQFHVDEDGIDATRWLNFRETNHSEYPG